MVGIKRPGRETDRPSTKKLKVQNGTKLRQARVGTLPSKTAPAHSTESDNASEDDRSNSDLSAEEDEEDSRDVSGTARPNGLSKRIRADDEGGNAVLNGQCPLRHAHLRAQVCVNACQALHHGNLTRSRRRWLRNESLRNPIPIR